MRVLWFTNEDENTFSKDAYNGGGWVTSLKNAIIEHAQQSQGLKLGIVTTGRTSKKNVIDDVTYYNLVGVQRYLFGYKKKERAFVARMLQVVDDFKPDVIQVFGTEREWGLIASHTEIPVVAHIQGILTPYYETWLPYNMSWGKLYMQNLRQWVLHHNLKMFISREKNIFKTVPFFMGRTDWDREMVSLLAPQSRYFFCNEMLRPQIYNSKKVWHLHQRETHKIITVISSPTYKGADVLLRAAKILKEYTNVAFEWNVYGLSSMRFVERLTGIASSDVNVITKGVISSEGLVDAMSDADIYVHPSYIENSSNTICEAQLLGVPVIATAVGGTETIIQGGTDGMLVHANDPYMMAQSVKKLLDEPDFAKYIGENGRLMALKRHNPENIVRRIMEIYELMRKN